ncbi:hypothetical protein N7449_003093 [Penicillium cf. viridicatum]|uniref:Uncharacterized protein n=1 Tax=Penicillium cf. viridicatum TaxID=2972119 RepID=A0A9W9T425_9EURO|nr:hypothetical protein N7449_003093 [Penicillium cf. viridicatum]
MAQYAMLMVPSSHSALGVPTEYSQETLSVGPLSSSHTAEFPYGHSSSALAVQSSVEACECALTEMASEVSLHKACGTHLWVLVPFVGGKELLGSEPFTTDAAY